MFAFGLDQNICKDWYRVEELKVQDGQIAEDLEMLRRALEA